MVFPLHRSRFRRLILPEFMYTYEDICRAKQGTQLNYVTCTDLNTTLVVQLWSHSGFSFLSKSRIKKGDRVL